MSIWDNFKLSDEKEDSQTVSKNIEKGIDFKGTNLWILVFAIFIASLGLNVNSTAVIIGAMLVSPLMGPIMGLGFGMAVNDIELLKKSFSSYVFAAGVGLATSTLFFLLSPLNDAHSEILARTSPNIYDVLIALFGGLAGMLVTSSKLKGNVIPGVAIATALMPPLCTAGYGLATVQFNFFFGAFYLFLINSVFIALATLIATKFLKFPFRHLPKREDEIRANKTVWAVTIITILPSIYFGYDAVQQNKFLQKANKFIENEAVFPNDYLLQKIINAKNKTITLTYGGEIIEDDQIEILKLKLGKYNLSDASIEVRQGFAYLQDNNNDEQTNQLTVVLNEKEKKIQYLQAKLDSISAQQSLGEQIYKELKAQHEEVLSLSVQPAINFTDSLQTQLWVAAISSKKAFNQDQQNKIEQWLKVRLGAEQIKIKFEK